jgi:hypothetical protein
MDSIGFTANQSKAGLIYYAVQPPSHLRLTGLDTEIREVI